MQQHYVHPVLSSYCHAVTTHVKPSLGESLPFHTHEHVVQANSAPRPPLVGTQHPMWGQWPLICKNMQFLHQMPLRLPVNHRKCCL